MVSCWYCVGKGCTTSFTWPYYLENTWTSNVTWFYTNWSKKIKLKAKSGGFASISWISTRRMVDCIPAVAANTLSCVENVCPVSLLSSVSYCHSVGRRPPARRSTCAERRHEETVNVSETERELLFTSCRRIRRAPILKCHSRVEGLSFQSISSAELSKNVQAMRAQQRLLLFIIIDVSRIMPWSH